MYRGFCPARAAGRLPGAGHGVRGENPLYTPCTPVLPFVREREICLLSWAAPIRRVSCGASARTFPAVPAGRCPRLLRRSVRPAGVRERLRARDTLHQRQGAEGETLPGGSEGGKLADGRAAFSSLSSGRARCVAASRFTFFKGKTL